MLSQLSLAVKAGLTSVQRRTSYKDLAYSLGRSTRLASVLGPLGLDLSGDGYRATDAASNSCRHIVSYCHLLSMYVG